MAMRKEGEKERSTEDARRNKASDESSHANPLNIAMDFRERPHRNRRGPALSGLTILTPPIARCISAARARSKWLMKKGQTDLACPLLHRTWNRWLLGSEIHHVNISSEAHVVGQIPAIVIRDPHR